MKKIKITLFSLSALLIFAITFFAGSFLGSYQSYMRESVFRGLFLVNDLKSLRQGNTEKQIATKERMLDGEIFAAMQSEKTGFSWVLFPFFQDNQKYLKSIANYRKQHPSTLKSKQSDAEYQFILANEELMKQYGQDNEVAK